MVDVTMFVNEAMGSLVPITGSDPSTGPWTHVAFVPTPLQDEPPELDPLTYLAVANARASLASLDSTAQLLPNPALLRQPTLRREAQSTSALEGTYEPVRDVLMAETDPPARSNMREILNYVRMASYAFSCVDEGRPLSAHLLCQMQEILVRGTKDEGSETGKLREKQVAVGRRDDAALRELPVHAARFVPSPPGDALEADVRLLLSWLDQDRASSIDPVVSAAMAHYQFETLHPFHDGNGRLGRLLIVMQLYRHGVLREPTLTVSPWFEARRSRYYELLHAVSCSGAWDPYIRFFASGIDESAQLTLRLLSSLVGVQAELKERVRSSPLRADTAQLLVDFAVARVSFTVREVQSELSISYGRANALVQQLMSLGILDVLDTAANTRRFYAPQVVDVLAQMG